jgi:hypothetical protein
MSHHSDEFLLYSENIPTVGIVVPQNYSIFYKRIRSDKKTPEKF